MYKVLQLAVFNHDTLIGINIYNVVNREENNFLILLELT